jgi:predicted porin
MKKSLVALAAMAVAGIASAQSSVTLFGVVDAGVSYYTNKTENAFGQGFKSSQWAASSSGYNSSRLGFRGTEDLGGGLAASFWLEAGLNNDTGAGQTIPGLAATSNGGGGLTFNRRSTVSLSGAFGEVRIGRDYTPTFWNDTVFDPFGTNGVGTNLISTANGFSSSGAITNGFTANNQYVRASNSVGYFLPPNLGGFYGQFMYAFNENTQYDPGTLTPPGAAALIANPALAAIGNNARAGRYIGGRVGYANGPLDVAISYGESTTSSNFFLGTTNNLDQGSIGASYDFGVVKLFGEYSDAKVKVDDSRITLAGAFGVSEPRAKGWLLGATVPVGPGLIRVAYSAVKYDNTLGARNQVFGVFDDPKADKFAIGYVHNLSKRTALYATAAVINNKDGADLLLGGPQYVQPVAGVTGPLTPKTSVGYDFGIRHAF